MPIYLIIQYLLLQHQSVIIPGIGALLIRRKKARIEETEKKLFPPKQEIHFNPQAIVDDANTLQLAVQQAHKNGEKLLSDYTETLQRELQDNESTTIKGIGTLRKEGAAIQFTVASNLERQLNPINNKPLSLPSQENKMPAKSITMNPAAASDPVRKTHARTNQSKHLFILAIIVTLISSGIAVYTFYFSSNPTPELTNIHPKAEREKSSATHEQHPNTQQQQADTLKGSNTSTKYYTQFNRFSLITGSFLNKTKAKKHQRELETQGFTNSHIIPHDSLFRVAIQTYHDRNEALERLHALRKTKGDDFVWLLSHKQ